MKRALALALLLPALALAQTKAGTQTVTSQFPVKATGTTTTRSLADRFANVYSVKDFGAKGDCSTDDTASIQAAITAAQTRTGIVDFPDVTDCYLLNSGLTVTADNVWLRGNNSRLEWANSYTGHGIEFKSTTVNTHVFNTGMSGFRLEPRAAGMTAVVYTLRVYGFTARDLRIDGPGTASATGAGILMDWGTSNTQDYATGHRIENVTIIGYKNAIQAVDPHSELVTNSYIAGNFLYCEAQANSIAIQDVYDGSQVIGNEIEGCTYGVKQSSSTGQGATIMANRFETNPSGDVYLGSAVYGISLLGNYHANGSGGNVFQNTTAQRNATIWDMTLNYQAQLPELIDLLNTGQSGDRPRVRFFNFGESANALATLQLFGTSGGTNAMGETVSTREFDSVGGDVLYKFGTTGNRDVYLYINSLNTLQFHRGTGENTVTTDANTLRFISAVADGSSAVAHAFDTSVSFSTAGAKVASFRKATAEVAYVDKDGKVMGGTLQAGSSGTGTLNANIFRGGGTVHIEGNVASNGTSTPIVLHNLTALTTAGDVIAVFASDAAGNTPQLKVDKDGIIIHSQAADSTGSPGNATANVAAGRSAFKASGSGGTAALTITNSLVTAASRVYAVLQTSGDATCSRVENVVPASGSFVINANAACTATANVAWEVFK